MLAAALLSAFVAASAYAQAQAQEPGRTYRVGVLSMSRLTPETMRRDMLPRLSQLGFSEGSNLVLDIRVGGLDEQLPALARDLVAGSDVIVVVGQNPLVALGQATRTLPIVSYGPDPTFMGLAQSLARPGGNVTGIHLILAGIHSKEVEILHEAVPAARKIAVLTNGSDTSDFYDLLTRAMANVGVDLRVFYARREDEYRAAFTAMREAGMEALMIDASPVFSGDGARLMALAQEARLPTACAGDMVRHGCMVNYATNLAAARARLADLVAAILRGASPGEMAIERPTEFVLVLNLRTARALDITIPPALVARATEVIE
jgi:putative ABC transport system substrate-binding protein